MGRALFRGGKAREPLIGSAPTGGGGGKERPDAADSPVFDAVGELIRLTDELFPVSVCGLRHLLAGLWQYFRSELPRQESGSRYRSTICWSRYGKQPTRPQQEQVCAAIGHVTGLRWSMNSGYRSGSVRHFLCGMLARGLPLFLSETQNRRFTVFVGRIFCLIWRPESATWIGDTGHQPAFDSTPHQGGECALFGNGRRPGIWRKRRRHQLQPVRAADRPLPALYLADDAASRRCSFCWLPAQMTDKGEPIASSHWTAAARRAGSCEGFTGERSLRLLTSVGGWQAWIGETSGTGHRWEAILPCWCPVPGRPARSVPSCVCAHCQCSAVRESALTSRKHALLAACCRRLPCQPGRAGCACAGVDAMGRHQYV